MVRGYLGYVTLLWVLQFGTQCIEAKVTSCRCLSTDSCWPSDEQFSALQKQLSQTLITPTPLAAACYPPSSPSGNCTEVQKNWFDAIWRADHPGQTQAPNWETFIFPNGTLDECPRDSVLGIACSQGSVPVLGVDARTAEDIQAAVKFAVKHNLRVVVKNTG